MKMGNISRFPRTIRLWEQRGRGRQSGVRFNCSKGEIDVPGVSYTRGSDETLCTPGV